MKNKKIRTLRRELLKHFIRILISVITLLVILGICVRKIKTANRIINEEVMYNNQLYKAEIAHYKWSNNLLLAIECGQEFTGGINPNACDFGKFLYGEALEGDSGLMKLVEKVEPYHNKIHASAEAILKLDENDREGKQQIFMEITMPSIETLVQILDGEISDRTANVSHKEQQFKYLLIICETVCFVNVLVVALCIGLLHRFLRKEITANLRKIAHEAEGLTEGQLSLDFGTSGIVKEIVDLKLSLNSSVRKLETYIHAIDFEMGEFAKGNLLAQSPIQFIGDFEQVKQSIMSFTEKISETLYEVENVAESVAESSQQIAGSVQELAAGTVEQAESFQKLSEKTEDIAGSIQVTAKNMKEINDIVSSCKLEVLEEKDKLQEVSDVMKQISSRAKQIKNIISTMDGIAAQTNLLALNAAIEAARAGKAGAGFSVVANEVQTLARHSAKAASEIKILVLDNIETVRHGYQKVRESIETLDEITGASIQISDRVEVISKNSQKESDTMVQIKEEVDYVSHTIEASAASTQENAASSQELAAQAEILRELTKQFQIKK